VVNDWNRGVDAEQNVVLISVPTVLGKGLAPPGKHVLHAYTPGTEPFSFWEGLDRKSVDYRRLKEERSEVHQRENIYASVLNSNFAPLITWSDYLAVKHIQHHFSSIGFVTNSSSVHFHWPNAFAHLLICNT
jgi:phytoene dehydrogenase-like protein